MNTSVVQGDALGSSQRIVLCSNSVPDVPAKGLETRSVVDWVLMSSAQQIHTYITSAFSVFSTYRSFSRSLIMKWKKSESYIQKGILFEWLTLWPRKIKPMTEVYNSFIPLSSTNNSSVKPTVNTSSQSQRRRSHPALLGFNGLSPTILWETQDLRVLPSEAPKDLSHICLYLLRYCFEFVFSWKTHYTCTGTSGDSSQSLGQSWAQGSSGSPSCLLVTGAREEMKINARSPSGCNY